MAPSAMSEVAFCRFVHVVLQAQTPGGGVLPSKRLLGMCRWMGSHFHN